MRPSYEAFHLPHDVEKIPIICICAGSGIAPFRGFFQERAAMKSAGRPLAPSILFYGCRLPGTDDLYREEFDTWEQLGAVSVRRAYSRDPQKSKGCKYVQDRVLADSEDVHRLWHQGAKVFVCGSRAMGKGVEDVWVKLAFESDSSEGSTNGAVTGEVKARQRLEAIRNIRYAVDIFD